MKVSFALVCEGSSDSSLIPHIQELFVRYGATEVSGEYADLTCFPRVGSSVKNKVDAVVTLMPHINVIIVHRDGDGVGAVGRELEIIEQTAHVKGKKIIPIIPIRMLEAWLILDEQAIRDVVGNSGSKVRLDLPTPISVEGVRDPKVKLYQTLEVASELTGARLKKFKKRLPAMRRRLAESLSPLGLVSQTESHARFCSYLKSYLNAVPFVEGDTCYRRSAT